MAYERIVISSGHGKYVRGASGIIDEVDEARRVVDELANELRDRGVDVKVFHDNTSQSQNENLNTIVNYHNAQTRDLDVSVHFNAYEQVEKPMGTEVFYVTQSALAGQVSAAIASCGFINRGGKKTGDLFFLNHTTMPALLIEVCFVDSEADCECYEVQFQAICTAIADVLGGGIEGGEELPPPDSDALFEATGRCSTFGGPDDTGVNRDEDLAFFEVEADIAKAPHLFLPYQPQGTTGLARRLNPHVHYIACRWDYDETPRSMLLEEVAIVRARKTGIALTAFPADWGPNETTGRVADLSPGLMQDLGIGTDDEVEVTFPA
jgi:N-acetylmuramoyl-L-alanine amidase